MRGCTVRAHYADIAAQGKIIFENLRMDIGLQTRFKLPPERARHA